MLPIVFIHTGTSYYLPTTLLQAAKASPNSPLFLLGDWGSLALGGVVKRQPISKYWKRAAELGSVFENYSSNAASFELICLQRWLALAEWMKVQGIEQCLYLDSDVMLYSAVDEALSTVPAHAGMTIAGISGHTNFILKRTVLEDFGAFIMNQYTKQGGKEELLEKFRAWNETHTAGGISDMTFFVDYQADFPERVANISQVVETPSGLTAFDITMDYTAHYEADHGLKAIEMDEQGRPWGQLKGEPGRKVRFHTLHFQGAESKRNLARYATTPLADRQALERANNRIGLAYRAWRRLFS
jgi:hypothetical protein